LSTQHGYIVHTAWNTDIQATKHLVNYQHRHVERKDIYFFWVMCNSSKNSATEKLSIAVYPELYRDMPRNVYQAIPDP